ncbi:MAG: S8 family serine peptidase [Pseudomonadota bacterium]
MIWHEWFQYSKKLIKKRKKLKRGLINLVVFYTSLIIACNVFAYDSSQRSWIALLDTGVSQDHLKIPVLGQVDLSSKEKVINLSFSTKDIQAPHDGGFRMGNELIPHGSWVAQSMANTMQAINPVALRNWSLLSMRIIDSEKGAHPASVIAALMWIDEITSDPEHKNQIKIIAIPAGTFSEYASDQIQVLLTKLSQKGILIFASVGNDRADHMTIPARLNDVISVTRLSKSNELYEYANTGEKWTLGLNPDISVGVTVWNPFRNTMVNSGGTSLSVGEVTAYAAYWVNTFPNQTRDINAFSQWIKSSCNSQHTMIKTQQVYVIRSIISRAC